MINVDMTQAEPLHTSTHSSQRTAHSRNSSNDTANSRGSRNQDSTSDAGDSDEFFTDSEGDDAQSSHSSRQPSPVVKGGLKSPRA